MSHTRVKPQILWWRKASMIASRFKCNVSFLNSFQFPFSEFRMQRKQTLRWRECIKGYWILILRVEKRVRRIRIEKHIRQGMKRRNHPPPGESAFSLLSLCTYYCIVDCRGRRKANIWKHLKFMGKRGWWPFWSRLTFVFCSTGGWFSIGFWWWDTSSRILLSLPSPKRREKI